MKAPTRGLGDKLMEIGARSPRDLHAIDVLADYVLARLNEDQPETKPYHWTCDDPPKGGTK